jgi:hypothetical protein
MTPSESSRRSVAPHLSDFLLKVEKVKKGKTRSITQLLREGPQPHILCVLLACFSILEP